MSGTNHCQQVCSYPALLTGAAYLVVQAACLGTEVPAVPHLATTGFSLPQQKCVRVTLQCPFKALPTGVGL